MECTAVCAHALILPCQSEGRVRVCWSRKLVTRLQGSLGADASMRRGTERSHFKRYTPSRHLGTIAALHRFLLTKTREIIQCDVKLDPAALHRFSGRYCRDCHSRSFHSSRQGQRSSRHARRSAATYPPNFLVRRRFDCATTTLLPSRIILIGVGILFLPRSTVISSLQAVPSSLQ